MADYERPECFTRHVSVDHNGVLDHNLSDGGPPQPPGELIRARFNPIVAGLTRLGR